MKKIILLALVLTSIHSYSQNLKLTASHPEPRAGQRISFKLTLDGIDSMFKASLPENAELTSSNALYSGFYNRGVRFNEPGEYNIGPFSFNINGSNYTSNSLKIKVIESIPDEKGIYIRHIITQEKEYILIERLKPFKDNKTGINLMLVENEIEGLKFVSGQNGTWKGDLPSTIKSEKKLIYTYKFYKIEKTSEFKGTVKLETKHFKGLPKDYVLPEIIIR